MEAICERCGEQFTTKNLKKKFCSKECRFKNHSEVLTGKKRPEISMRFRGEKNPNWKGGRRFDKDGYVIVNAPPNHPFANQNGGIREHRLIAEKQIGRHLQRDEVCHHINGIKDDNRIENLIVMKKKSHDRESYFKRDKDEKGRLL